MMKEEGRRKKEEGEGHSVACMSISIVLLVHSTTGS